MTAICEGISWFSYPSDFGDMKQKQARLVPWLSGLIFRHLRPGRVSHIHSFCLGSDVSRGIVQYASSGENQ